ncbi:MAG: DUF3604 domain-containing protein [Myxococcota bacterium]|nr:DUF3604 domain-containing protein [Myxococcota bacterium]
MSHSRQIRLLFIVLSISIPILTFIACGGGDEPPSILDGDPGAQKLRARLTSQSVFDTPTEILELAPPARNPNRVALFGDLHVHTKYSFDAYAMGTLATPYDAYRFALGEAIPHAAGFDLQLKQPLDFYAVTDHAMFLGVAPESGDITTAFSQLDVAKPLNGINDPDNMGVTSVPGRLRAFGTFLPRLLLAVVQDETLDRETVLDITRTAWQDTIAAAELYNDPGHFTTFIAYEYTSSTDDMGNLHRNVIFKGSDRIPAVPFSRFHSQNPEGLWEWMDDLREQGIESLAIPHNSNGSNGQMFKLVDWAGDPIDNDYAAQRIRNEPLVEITQIKGTSETHPLLSTTDEWADFEIMPFRVASPEYSEPKGSYVREALRNGMALERQGIENPYSMGFVGSSDTHTAASQNDESDYVSKLGLLSVTPDLRGSVPLNPLIALVAGYAVPQRLDEVYGESYVGGATPTYGASGLAAVWAEENTREAIYEAFRRKETFATSGPRISLRFFAGYDYDSDMLDDPDVMARAYAEGVSMGADLPAQGTDAPNFLLWALADPNTTSLQRLQVIKGWIDSEGETHEAVFDVACSGGVGIDPATHRCPDNGASVDIGDCSVSGDGAAQLRAVWSDPGFDPGERAFYYARVLENPTCRWSTWDAVRAGIPARSDLATTIQERAWSSPIQYQPAGASLKR